MTAPAAMDAEMKSLHHDKVWDLVELSKYRKTVLSKWVYKVKTRPEGLNE